MIKIFIDESGTYADAEVMARMDGPVEEEAPDRDLSYSR
jgi:hypothetical protein